MLQIWYHCCCWGKYAVASNLANLVQFPVGSVYWLGVLSGVSPLLQDQGDQIVKCIIINKSVALQLRRVKTD